MLGEGLLGQGSLLQAFSPRHLRLMPLLLGMAAVD